MKNITIFGGSQTRPGEPAYEEARRLGELLARSGYVVVSGGYIGTMEAVSRGAAEAGGHVVGITCAEIEAYRPGRANPWVEEERRFATLRERIHALIQDSDAALALPGGAGTLAEVAMMWNHLLVGAISPRPLILVGQAWQATMRSFIEHFEPFIPAKERAWLHFAPDALAALALLSTQT